ncbi:DUF3060 domain-containing protein [Mycobacterium deserti]|uniref:DUF3060 domain-containing protein n=1 Tax=Mycobacterium deserti TaxID=2978347 RepID=A0ABT2M7Q6_9MYCO|nr:DUF3060 domain-containing protein [Mycobacterium deserti]MCT7658295.1 DUF3060 domain-containing protein [Mycobacterium deserti]
MNSQDDPEARIRQLENSAGQYGAVELGATESSGAGYTPTAPLPPPPAYGAPPPTFSDPYAAPPMYGGAPMQVSKKGAPIGLIFGLLAVVAVLIFGVIGVVAWNAMSKVETVTTRPGGSDVAGGGGSVDGPPADAPTDQPPFVMPELPDLSGPTEAPAGARLNVSGVDENKTITCNDNIVSVSGVNNTVTITGHCSSLSVSGVENNVTIDSADTIGASGFDNQVIYRSGTPEVAATGSNVVSQG